MPGYVIANIEVHDHDMFAEYVSKTPATISKYGGSYVLKGGQTDVKEGDGVHRVIELKFDSYEIAQRWYDSPEYGAVRPLRQKATTSTLFIIDGVGEN